MINLTCIKLIKNTKGKTIGYRLKSTDGIIIDIPEKKLKKKILKGEYAVDNLLSTLNSNTPYKTTKKKLNKIKYKTVKIKKATGENIIFPVGKSTITLKSLEELFKGDEYFNEIYNTFYEVFTDDNSKIEVTTRFRKGEYKHIDFCYWDEDNLVGYGEIGYFYDCLGNNQTIPYVDYYIN